MMLYNSDQVGSKKNILFMVEINVRKEDEQGT